MALSIFFKFNLRISKQSGQITKHSSDKDFKLSAIYEYTLIGLSVPLGVNKEYETTYVDKDSST